jgi:hypothetical protein
MGSPEKRLERLRESNRKTAQLLSETAPQVGIFWIHPKTLLLIGCYGEPRAQGDEFLHPYIDCHATHPNLWQTVGLNYPDLADKNWDEVPRGRVYFDKDDKQNHVYGPDKHILNVEIQEQVLRQFNLSAAHTIFEPNDDYKI